MLLENEYSHRGTFWIGSNEETDWFISGLNKNLTYFRTVYGKEDIVKVHGMKKTDVRKDLKLGKGTWKGPSAFLTKGKLSFSGKKTLKSSKLGDFKFFVEFYSY